MVFNRKAEIKPAVSPTSGPRPMEPAAGASPMAGVPSQTEVESIIGNDLSIEGQSITIRCQGSLRVNGNIQADLHGKRIVVGEEAVIRGSIAADEVVVLGQVNGQILGSNVILHASADVDGDIHSQHLALERGASFNGRSRRVNDPSEVAPQLASASQAGRPQVVGSAREGVTQGLPTSPLAMPPSRTAF